jgi:PhnB protein
MAPPALGHGVHLVRRRPGFLGVFIYLVVGMWERAVAGGAEVIYPYEVQSYGDEGGRIRDPFGHQWGIWHHVEDVDEDETARRMAAFYESDGG